MLPLFIGSTFIAGIMWIAKLTSPKSDKEWHDEQEREEFMREHEKWSKATVFQQLLR